MYCEELKNVRERTVQFCLLKDLKIPSCTVALKLLLMDMMKKKRLKFTKEHKDWTVGNEFKSCGLTKVISMKMNHKNYLELLCNYQSSSSEMTQAGIFMQDGAPCHIEK